MAVSVVGSASSVSSASMAALQAPAWLGQANLTRCQNGLNSRQARETWKYSPLAKTTRALLEAPRAQGPPIKNPPKQVRVRRFSDLQSPPNIHVDLGRYPLVGIAGALAGDGWLVEVGETLDEPLRLTTPTAGVAPPLMLRIGSGCRVHIEQLDEDASLAEAKHLSAAVMLLSLAEDAEVQWSRTHLGRSSQGWSFLEARLERNTALRIHHHVATEAFHRLDLNVILHGEGARLTTTGGALAMSGANLDQQYVIEHLGRNTVSRTKQHNLVAGGGRCTFNGRVHIHPGATGADADLTNRNLALAANAEVNTKPELEIYNDEVRCAHGATVGQLDESALFYLKSRGLTTERARSLLSLGFLRDGLSGPLAGKAEAFMGQAFATSQSG